MKIHTPQSPTLTGAFARLALLVCLLAAALAQPASALAQNNAVVLDSVLVDIRPEFDQPSVLVMYIITLSPNVSFPATMRFRVPANATIHAVAMEDPTGLFNLDYKPQAAGDWIDIVFTAPVQNVRVEYYEPFDRKEGAEREYTFTWPGDYTVNNLTVQVQQPFTASGMTFVPPQSGSSQADDGLIYYGIPVGNVNAGTEFDLVMRYNKPDDTLTYSERFQPAQPNQPVSGTTAGRVNMSQLLPWIIGAVGVALIAGGILWYTYTGRVPVAESQSRRRRHASSPRTPSAVSAPAPSSGEAVFCSQCGKKSGAGDVFCRSCGTRLQ